MSNYRAPTMTPPLTPAKIVLPGEPPVPASATHAYFYSEQQASLTGQHCYAPGVGGSNQPYTQDVALDGPDAQQQIDDYLKSYPDARLAAFGDGSAQTIPPRTIDRRLTLAQP